MPKSDLMPATQLTCGGKGPCCHVGYAHRHCEHCDVVIDTRPQLPPNWPMAGSGPRWGTGDAVGQFVSPTARPMQGPPTVYAQNSGTASGTLYMEAINRWHAHEGNTGDFAKSLAAHTCEGEP